MRLVAGTYDRHPMDVDALHNLKDFTGSVNGSLTSFLGIPFAKSPYAQLMLFRFDHVVTLGQYRKQAFPPS